MLLPSIDLPFSLHMLQAAGAAAGVAAGAAEVTLQAAGAAAGTAAGTAAGVAVSASRYAIVAKDTASAKLSGPLHLVLNFYYSLQDLAATLLAFFLSALTTTTRRVYCTASYAAGAATGVTQSAMEVLADKPAFQNGHNRASSMLAQAPASATEAVQAAERAGRGVAQQAQQAGEAVGEAVGYVPYGKEAQQTMGLGHGLVINPGEVQPQGVQRKGLPGVVAGAADALAGAVQRAQRVTAEVLTPARTSFQEHYESSKKHTEERMENAVESE